MVTIGDMNGLIKVAAVAAVAVLAALAACGEEAEPTADAALPSCTSTCGDGPLFCTADGVCSCTLGGERVYCQRAPQP